MTGVLEFHIDCTCVLKDWSSIKQNRNTNFIHMKHIMSKIGFPKSMLGVGLWCLEWEVFTFMKIIIILIFVHNQLEMLQNFCRCSLL